MTGNKEQKGFLNVIKDFQPRWALITGCLVLFVTIQIGITQADPSSSSGQAPSSGSGQSSFQLTLPLGLEKESLVIPEDNPLTKDKVELGKLLFFDKRLSANDTIACASCHMPSMAFTDGQPVSAGIHGQKGGAKRSDGHQPGLQFGPILGRACGHARGAIRGPVRQPHRAWVQGSRRTRRQGEEHRRVSALI